MRALGELNLRDLSSTPQISGALSIAQFNLRTFLDGIGHPLPATADANAFAKLELVTRLEGSPTAMTLFRSWKVRQPPSPCQTWR